MQQAPTSRQAPHMCKQAALFVQAGHRSASADQHADLKPTFACLLGAPQVPYVHDKSPKPALWTFQLSYAPLGDFLPMAKARISQWGTGCDMGTESRP